MTAQHNAMETAEDIAALKSSFHSKVKELSLSDAKQVQVTDAQKLELYGLFMTSTYGREDDNANSNKRYNNDSTNANINKRELLKREAWKSKSNLTKQEAMKRYIDTANSILKANGVPSMGRMSPIRYNNSKDSLLSALPLKYAGVLYKFRHRNNSWRKLYFELREQVLYYFEKEDTYYPSGYIFLTNVLISDKTERLPNPGVEETFFKFAITHAESNSRLVLATVDEMDGKKWIEALKISSVASPVMVEPAAASGHAAGTILGSLMKNKKHRASLETLNNNQGASSPAATGGGGGGGSNNNKRATLLLKYRTESQRLFGIQGSRYAQIADEAVDMLLENSNWKNTENWSFLSNKNGVKLYVPTKEFMNNTIAVGCALGEMEMNLPARLVFDYAWLPGLRSTYDPQIDKYSIVETLGNQTRIESLLYKSVFPTAPRDFCRLIHFRVQLDGKIVIAACSLDHPMSPVHENAVRAHLICTGFVIRPLTPHSCSVSYLIMVDPKVTNIPRSIILSTTASQPTILENLHVFLNRKIKSEPELLPKILSLGSVTNNEGEKKSTKNLEFIRNLNQSEIGGMIEGAKDDLGRGRRLLVEYRVQIMVSILLWAAFVSSYYYFTLSNNDV